MRGARQIFIWILILGLPLQALIAAALEVRGPSHIHVDALADDEPFPHHAHLDVERHYHLQGEGAVPVEEEDEDDHQHAAAVVESGLLKVGSAASLLALIPSQSLFELPELAQSLPVDRSKQLGTRYLGRLERPPRAAPL